MPEKTSRAPLEGDPAKTKHKSCYKNTDFWAKSQEVSLFDGIKPKVISKTTIQGVLNAVQAVRYKKQIEYLRTLDEAEYKNQKCLLPAVTFGGTFTHRNNEFIIKPTGFIVPDLDHLKNVDNVFDMLRQDKYIYFAFRSPGGDGIKAGIRAKNINNDADHKLFFKAVEQYFKEVYGITIDRQCNDISRLTFLSYDPKLYINPEPHLFNIESWKPASA